MGHPSSVVQAAWGAYTLRGRAGAEARRARDYE